MSEKRVIILTGSSRGIGRAAAELLAARGHAVVISSRKQESCDEVAGEIESRGGDALPVACHIGREEQLEALVERTVDHFGRLDGIVMNAASNPVYGSTEKVDREAFDVIMRNNVYSAMR
ncbi:MAG: SDR family NAD(P)-dependent oxidoreductase, partial [Wenzhouxiangella sp.]